jgi:hypothetical protein
MAVTSVEDMLSVPGPRAWIASALMEQMHTVRTLCFLDNEYGDKANISNAFGLRVEAAVIRRLARGLKPVRIFRIGIHHSQLHTVTVDYSAMDGSPAATMHLAIYHPSDRARAREKNFELAGEQFQNGVPRRGRKNGSGSDLHAKNERVRKTRKALKKNDW